MSSIDQQFIEYIVKSIVGHPDDVKVERRIDEKGVLLELTVNAEDLGRVIGKRGATAQSIRTLLRALGTKNDARYNLKIIDVGSPPPAKSSDKPAAKPADDTAQDNEDTESEPVGVEEMEDEAEVEAPKESDRGSVVDRTRKELAELDDLDV